VLVERCAVEPDFFVRDMPSWVLTRLPPEITLPRIRHELDSERPQARSQALHTLAEGPGSRSNLALTVLRAAGSEAAGTDTPSVTDVDIPGPQ
jgi:hypothetical protein